MPVRDIAVVLAPKERFAASGAGAVSLCVRDSALASRFLERLLVMGVPVAEPFPMIAYEGVASGLWQLAGRNRGLALAIGQKLRRRSVRLVEVQNRPHMATLLKRLLPRCRVTLHLHNDPWSMAGLQHAGDRQSVLDQLDGVLCVSDYVRARLLDGVATDAAKVQRIHNGVVLPAHPPPTKDNEILFVGRLVRDKGLAHLAEALATLLPSRPTWRARLIGASWFGERAPDAFERELRARLAPLGERVAFEGFKPHDAVVHAMARASIVVVPTLVAEAFARVAAEAMAAGCAVVVYPSGALAEVGAGRAWVTEAPDQRLLAAALAALMDDADLLARWQRAARADFPFAIEQVTRELDDWRAALLDAAA